MMPMSASSERMAASASALRRLAKLNTGSPRASASALSTSGLAPGLSGAQKMPATSSPRARKASRTALPKSCWPMNAMRAMGRPSTEDEVGGEAVQHHAEQFSQRPGVGAVRGARAHRRHQHAEDRDHEQAQQVQV